MTTTLLRFTTEADAILGLFYINGKFACFTLENDKCEIGEGKYALQFAIPPPPRLSEAYGHNLIEVVIPGTTHMGGRDQILLHIGNIPTDSKGCILLGDSVDTHTTVNDLSKIYNSKRAYERVYTVLTHALKQGEDISLYVASVAPLRGTIDVDKLVTIS